MVRLLRLPAGGTAPRLRKETLMEKLLSEILTLARESGGGGVSLKSLAPQDIAGLVLLLKDGRVALLNLEAAR